jgi:hypothetical protein
VAFRAARPAWSGHASSARRLGAGPRFYPPVRGCRSWVGGRVILALCELKQLVRRGDDIFNFRAVFSFQQRDCVDQHRLVGDELCSLFKLGQCGAAGDMSTKRILIFT